MEQTNIQSPVPNKKKTIISIIILLIVLIVVVVLLSSKSKNLGVDNPANTTVAGEEDLLAEINDATTFDNEADLKEIDKEFQ